MYDTRFYPSKIQQILKDVLDQKLGKQNYDKFQVPILTEDILRAIREKILEKVKMPRYKLCYQIVIGELKGQGVRVTSKCLWDPAFDNYASYSMKNESLFAVAICFGCYYE